MSASGKMISYRRPGPIPKEGIMHRSPRLVMGSPDQDGYIFITDPKRFLHAVVLMTWNGPRPQGMEVRHLDGNKLNNSLANLAWGTSKQNGADKAGHGSCKGARNGSAKMNEQIVLQLREDRNHMPLSALEVKYSQFSKFAVWAALTGYTWAHLPNARIGNRKCSKEGWKSGIRIQK